MILVQFVSNQSHKNTCLLDTEKLNLGYSDKPRLNNWTYVHLHYSIIIEMSEYKMDANRKILYKFQH